MFKYFTWIVLVALLILAGVAAFFWLTPPSNQQVTGVAISGERQEAPVEESSVANSQSVSVEPEQPREMEMVPNVVGQRVAIARQLATLSNLELCPGEFFIAPQNWRENIRPNVIYLQTPQGKSPLESGRSVAVWTFSKAEATQAIVETPSVIGLTQDKAQQRLAEAGLQVMNPPVQSGTSSKIVEQFPKPGQAVYKQTSVFLRATNTY